ncbi:hypothetical protein Tdes44962_MAKER00736 [Teratosphaeria destructans]|uniref:Uncharacterized protein n=1 Tax=Teratosphaeria destructans TaxID=418781 RepID=A0A9W7VZM3_9PEZI|nr:hypothetical protein Tdes44962_MAKER00736 [Teratosphaeria destructans]
MALEVPLTVACLTLFGIADGDTYRTKLWQNGYDKGFNSPPNEVLYDYANYRKPHVPLCWSSFLVQYQIVISVLSMFLLLVKSVMYTMHCWVPLLSAFVSALEIVLYAIALRNQSAPDLSDSKYPNHGLPWMMSKGCKYAEPGNWGYCMQARASYGVTIVMIILFFAYLCLSFYSTLRPMPEEKLQRSIDRKEDIEMKKVLSYYNTQDELSKEERWERNRQIFLNLPKTPNTAGFGRLNPMTPRTVAFTQLNGGKAPAHASSREVKEERVASPVSAGSGPTGGLRFREEYPEYPEVKIPNAK